MFSITFIESLLFSGIIGGKDSTFSLITTPTTPVELLFPIEFFFFVFKDEISNSSRDFDRCFFLFVTNLEVDSMIILYNKHNISKLFSETITFLNLRKSINKKN